MDVRDVIRRSISITEFNRGKAGAVIKDVKNNGPMVVLKNNKAVGVVMSPAEYCEMMDKIEELEAVLNQYRQSDLRRRIAEAGPPQKLG